MNRDNRQYFKQQAASSKQQAASSKQQAASSKQQAASSKQQAASSKRADISAIRLIATLMIITCHILQYLSIELAWWFNVGVQIFFCLSGFLYGQKEPEEVTSYYKRRFLKILIPYYIVFVFFGVLLFAFKRHCFNGISFAGGLLCRTQISGGEHLWFVSYILMCYSITPLLHVYRERFIDRLRNWWIGFFFSLTVATIVFGLFADFYNPAWICCYVIGYFLGINEREKYINDRVMLILFGMISIAGNAAQIYIDYLRRLSFSGKVEVVYNYCRNYNHVCLGVFLFLLSITIFRKVVFTLNTKIALNITDQYSYETYLVHQFLIIGPFSLMALTPCLIINILVIIVGIGLLAWVLKQIETRLLQVFT